MRRAVAARSGDDHRTAGDRHVGAGPSRAEGRGPAAVHGGGRAFRRRARRQADGGAQRAPPRPHPLPRRRRPADGAAGPRLAVPDGGRGGDGRRRHPRRGCRRSCAASIGTAAAAVAAEPDALVIIDSPEFTHPIARRVRRRRPEIPIIDYVSPSVWAWRPGRARKMRAYVDHVLALLPFEPDAHQRLGGPPCTYVGHPLIERLAWIAALDTGAAGRAPGAAARTRRCWSCCRAAAPRRSAADAAVRRGR